MDPTAAIGALVTSVLSGGSNAIIAIMLFVIGASVLVVRYLVLEIKDQRSQIHETNERYLRLLQAYHDSNNTVTSALNDLRIVLIEIRAKL
ncbi:MAG: hypothetical protein HC836_16530 [Richelia sp. RM2_1_2]|nr:hypothetical protein [Richelia sp. RM2_1_2]